MNHPKREEWIPWICGEADGPAREHLQRHLTECQECAREVDAWRRSLKKLDRWTLPGRTKMPRSEPIRKWALAALIILGLGFVIGRSSSRDQVDLAAWRQDVEQSVRRSMQKDFATAIQEVRDEQAKSLATAENRIARLAQAQNEQLWQNVVDTLASARTDDAQSIRAALQQADDRHSAEIVSVRKDLETLATMTDEEIRNARVKLMQLAALNSPAQ
jgi:hypothetical protein